MDKVYRLFNMLQPESLDELVVTKGLVTFLNPFSISKVKGNESIYLNFTYICSDGILPTLLNQLFKYRKIKRISFDFTSLASVIFKYGVENNKNFYFLGADQDSICAFIKKIRVLYPELIISGYHHGFFLENEIDIIDSIVQISPDILIIGMGTPYQDIIANKIFQLGFSGAIYTCGGFFTQIANSTNEEYYPKVFNKLNIRWLYRIIKEPHTRKRYLFYYPKFVLSYSFFLFKERFVEIKNTKS
ncbi:WecB/TagA/CpsF family glycosyltransferase [Rodentibacter caecimuris]|uniref:WecB/TagA/CpsF family glycosyltransferase n=1 Tax=Rodentibacter caecimuris TaxID=1796644 RepID=UPI0013A091CB|nr:WecB/TagA/CpsF family glycosyltransferase [Rodentibacter heylii]QIA77856.1 WecB/TagA/CpsF family glycosyltransferase [Rodentibacter heylii]